MAYSIQSLNFNPLRNPSFLISLLFTRQATQPIPNNNLEKVLLAYSHVFSVSLLRSMEVSFIPVPLVMYFTGFFFNFLVFFILFPRVGPASLIGGDSRPLPSALFFLFLANRQGECKQSVALIRESWALTSGQ